MENLADKQIRIARALLNLGHSYLHTVDIENSEEESEETEAGGTDSDEAESEEKEVQKKIKVNKQQIIGEKQDQFDKQYINKVNMKQQKLEKKTKLEDIPQYFYNDIQQKSNKIAPVQVDTEKHEIEKKVVNKSYHDEHDKLSTNLSKEFNNSVQKKLECGVELIGEEQNELSKKQQNLDVDGQSEIVKDKKYECNEELIKDFEKEKQEIQIQLQIEAPPMPGAEVELYLDIQVDSECQQKLDINKHEELGENQQNIDKDNQKAFYENLKHTVHKGIQLLNKNVQIKFDKVNLSQDIEEDIQDKINKELIQNMEEEDIQPKLHDNFQEQFYNEVQQNVKELQQDDEETQKNIYEDNMDENHKRILQEIDLLISDLQGKEKIKNNVNEEGEEEEECDELLAIRIAKITKEIEELELDMDQKHDEELEKKYNDEFNRMFSTEVKEKFLEKLLFSFKQESAPYYKRIENLLNIYFPTELDKINGKISIDPNHSKFNEDLRERSDLSVNKIEETQEEINNKIDKLKEIEEGSNVNTHTFEKVLEEIDIEMEEFKDEVEQEKSDIENEDEIQEDSDVDVEGFDDEVKKDLDWNLQIESELNTDESDRQSSQESEEEIEKINEDINIVTEIVDDFETIESSSVEELNSIDESASMENEISSTDEKFSSTELKQCKRDIQQKIDKEEQIKCIDSVHELQRNVNEKSDNDKSQKFEDLHLQMEIENIQDLDEIPLKLKIQQEQLEEKLHQQMKKFQEEFYKNSKLEYDKEQQLKGNTLNDPVYDKQQKLFYELKDKFQKTKEEYKDLVQQKMIEALQQKVDEKQLLEMKEFPEEFVEPNLEIEDLHKEVLQLERECTELEPEFSYNIPLVVDEIPSNKKNKKVKYNLFEKLHEIHKKKLCFFADSKEWPEKYLYPSCLLDELFDDPSEVNPNVFVITLYSVDIGYSVKITMNKDKPPVETFYSYAEDSILEFVEREQLPPCLLHLFDKADPMLFYNGRVIAEIHNKYHADESTRIYRILLHPHSLSIQSDLNRIIAQCSPKHCSYKRRLKIESKLIRLNFPVMCMDPSPIAGLTVQLQHQLLSRRTIILNPLKVINDDSSKFEMDLLKKSQEDTLSETKLNKSQKLSKSMEDIASDNIIHHLLWKFDFRLLSFKLIKLYIFVITETREYSMLLCMNSKVPHALKMRFKINLETNKLKAYIDVILEILKKKVNPDIIAVRRYKSDDKSVPRSIMCVPLLLSDHIYEPKPTDICKLLEELLVNIHKYQSNQQKTDETKRRLKVNNKMESKKKSINFGSSKTLSRNLEINIDKKRKKQVQAFESKKSIPHKVESSLTNTISVDSFSAKEVPVVSLEQYSALPPVSSTTTAMSFVPRQKTIFSSATLNTENTDYQIASKNVQQFKDHNVSKNVKSKPVMQLKTDHKKRLEKNYILLEKLFNNTSINSRLPLYKSVNDNKSKLSSRNDQMKNITVVKHVHRNSICLKGSDVTINKDKLPLIADITEEKFSNEPNDIYQETTQVDDNSTTNIDSLSNLQVTLPNSVITLFPSSLNKSNNQYQNNDVSFQEINVSSFSNTEDIKAAKRKRSS
ncbi:myosin-2 heavy chain-like [Melanaphis sacchari]|uniref:myosin-2 heavy chain-like n=1 Tax=Melanaphis sacchari TaxID=742174 RepID=UPI000DC1524D|nr:myosin-2 heavy chain-like [Melanaphis sacchari]XP_025205152.1 myosin-2 heavy chain-like [Melanaphis sacchari]